MLVLRSLIFGAVSLGLIAAAGPAVSQTAVTVATEASYPPFSKTEANGTFTGLEIELGNAVCERAQLNCTWVKQDFDGMIPGLLAKKFDFVFSSMTITPAREEVVAFSIPYYSSPSKFIGAKGLTLETTNEGLKGKTVGVYGGSAQDDFLQAKFPDVIIRRYTNFDQSSSDLVAGRLDLLFDGAVAAVDFFKSPQGAGYEFIGPDFSDPTILGLGAGAMFRKEDAELLSKVNDAIRSVYADGTYDQIASKYFTSFSLRADGAWR